MRDRWESHPKPMINILMLASLILQTELQHPILRQHINPVPIEPTLNSNQLDPHRGLIMCHGQAHQAPDIPDFVKHLPYETGDINPIANPTHIVDFLDWNRLEELGYYTYSLDHYGPTGTRFFFVIYLYHLRQIQIPGGWIMFRYGFVGLDAILSDVSNLSKSEILNLYAEYLTLLIQYCGCQSFEWYHLQTKQTLTSVDQCEYRLDGNGDIVADENLILIIRI